MAKPFHIKLDEATSFYIGYIFYQSITVVVFFHWFSLVLSIKVLLILAIRFCYWPYLYQNWWMIKRNFLVCDFRNSDWRYSLSVCVQPKSKIIRTRKTPNTAPFTLWICRENLLYGLLLWYKSLFLPPFQFYNQ